MMMLARAAGDTGRITTTLWWIVGRTLVGEGLMLDRLEHDPERGPSYRLHGRRSGLDKPLAGGKLGPGVVMLGGGSCASACEQVANAMAHSQKKLRRITFMSVLQLVEKVADSETLLCDGRMPATPTMPRPAAGCSMVRERRPS